MTSLRRVCVSGCTDLDAPTLARRGEDRNAADGAGATAKTHATTHAPAHDPLLTIVDSITRLVVSGGDRARPRQRKGGGNVESRKMDPCCTHHVQCPLLRFAEI